ncbi:tetratricopeptide repeat protein [Candidatus Kuenenia stuttgartensis]|uniref:tetratricopeptide repeat protein n=1 Tax=Kuenenia stuttgartiensis TaxID=174633 RepID=UPI00146D0961|nr:hypothetical protein [Candidatus Kuenenia stuttgartiensis]
MRLTLSEIYEKLGKKTERNGEIEKIKEILENNIEIGSRNPREYFLLCQIYSSQNNIDEATKTIEKMRLLPLEAETEKMFTLCWPIFITNVKNMIRWKRTCVWP